MAEEKPFEISVVEPGSNASQRVTVGRFDLEQITMALTADRAGIEQLPRMLLDLARGHLSSPRVQAVARLVHSARTGPIGSAMSYATDLRFGNVSATPGSH